MKKSLFIGALLMCTSAFSQIKKSEYDASSKSYFIMTDKKIIADGTRGFIASNNNAIVLTLDGVCETNAIITEGAKAVFTLDDGSTVTLVSPQTIQHANYFAEGIFKFEFLYAIDTNQLKMLATHKYTKITLYTEDAPLIFKARKIQNLVLLINSFLAEYDKHKAQIASN